MIMIQKSSTKYQQIHYLISDLSQSCINCVISKRINTQDQWKKNSVSSNRTTHNFDKGSKEIQWINSHFRKQCWSNWRYRGKRIKPKSIPLLKDACFCYFCYCCSNIISLNTVFLVSHQLDKKAQLP